MNKLKIKYYLFVVSDISFIGGVQLYIKRKCEYLSKNNYIPLIITGDNLNVMVSELNKYKQLMIEELMFPPIYFSLKKISKVIIKIVNWIKNNCNEDDNIVIESNNIGAALWSELIAKKLKTINILYFLGNDEAIRNSVYYQEYAKFKLKKNELILVTDKSMQIMFGNNENIDKFKNDYVNIPFEKNEIIKDNSSIMPFLNNIDNSSFVISTVSRLEKKYIHKLIESTGKIAKDNSKDKFVLIIVGNSKYKNLLDKFKEKYKFFQKNLDVIFTGYINPLPEILFKRTHIFVGMGTSVINSISQGCATICFDPRTNLSAGILGLSIRNFAYNDKEKENILEYDISKLLYNKKLLKEAEIRGKKLFEEEYSNEIIMKKFIDLFNEIIKHSEKKYYNVFDYRGKISKKEQLKIFLFKILGRKEYLFLVNKIITPLRFLQIFIEDRYKLFSFK